MTNRLGLTAAVFALTSCLGVEALSADQGALVETTTRGTVGVLLDEIPLPMRDRVAKRIAAKPPAFWAQRAAAQLRLTSYRLVYREFYHDEGQKQLPLPPEQVWQIVPLGAPQRDKDYGGHDVVKVDYAFSSTLLTDVDSPGVSEKRLQEVGGSHVEPFILPLDPEMLLQRTGVACMDEDSFPFNSLDSEEVDSFYDRDCEVEDELGNEGQCHYTRQATQSCVKAIEAQVGRVDLEMTYRRLAWDKAHADRVRVGPVTGEQPDLKVYQPDFRPSRITYRYIHADGCEVDEQCVGGTGWRRLLQFATSDENVGEKPLSIGSVDYFVSGEGAELDEHNLFEHSACHNHFHFQYYGTFRWEGDQSFTRKHGFCLQSTARVANRETSPLHNDFAGCDRQGVAAGWVDQYKAGLPCQWLDITDLAPGPGLRGFQSNPQGYLCEGTFVDAKGQPISDGEPVVWADTGRTAANGEAVEAPLCALAPDWNANNTFEVEETIPPHGQGLITTDCSRGQIGGLRNCGFRLEQARNTCEPGASVTLFCSVAPQAEPQVVRVCEYSHALGTAIPCRYEDTWVPLSPGVSDQPYTLATAVVTSAPTEVSFTCPAARRAGTEEPGGAYSLYAGAVFPDDGHQGVTCQ
ncbi:MAG: lysyl oxidase family protein [Kiloniellales bacterium]|nr:lysyl oxidase family protein [Kiloniellales bacterium]